jgi:hypothetical protein
MTERFKFRRGLPPPSARTSYSRAHRRDALVIVRAVIEQTAYIDDCRAPESLTKNGVVIGDKVNGFIGSAPPKSGIP